MGTSYTEKQREALKKYYPDGNYEVLSKWFPGKTKQQISAAANRKGLKRNHPGYQIDRTGQQYGQLTVLGFDHIDKGKQNIAYWKCRCSCGKELFSALAHSSFRYPLGTQQKRSSVSPCLFM